MQTFFWSLIGSLLASPGREDSLIFMVYQQMHGRFRASKNDSGRRRVIMDAKRLRD